MSGSEPRDCEWKRCVPLPKRTFKIRLVVYTFNSPCHVNINGPDGGYSCSLRPVLAVRSEAEPQLADINCEQEINLRFVSH